MLQEERKLAIKSDLQMIIDINRIGSDEEDCILDAIDSLETEDYVMVRELCEEVLSFSDRIGSDEIYILEEVIKELRPFKKEPLFKRG